MYVYERMNEQLFIDAFSSSETRNNQFSREALRVLFGFYDQLADDSQEPIQFDMVAICSEWTEMDAEELGEQYGELTEEEMSMNYVLPVEHYGEPTTYLVHESFSTSGR